MGVGIFHLFYRRILPSGPQLGAMMGELMAMMTYILFVIDLNEA